MAPEMVIMLTQSSREKVGYSNAVDWWSLGVTMFKLLTGYRPFSEENFTSFMDMAPTLRAKANMGASPEYAILFQQIPFPRAMSDNAVDIISRLLDVNEKTRLGSGPRGVAEIKEHPFFDNIKWELLEQKHVEPPYKPTIKSSAMSDPHRYPTFEALLTDIGKTSWLTDVPDPEDQKFFAAWCVPTHDKDRVASPVTRHPSSHSLVLLCLLSATVQGLHVAADAPCGVRHRPGDGAARPVLQGPADARGAQVTRRTPPLVGLVSRAIRCHPYNSNSNSSTHTYPSSEKGQRICAHKHHTVVAFNSLRLL